MALIDINWRPPPRFLRQFGLICLVLFGLLGGWVMLRRSIFGFGLTESAAGATAYGLWGAALVCGLLAAVMPAALRPIYVGLSAVALPIGVVMSYLVLGLVYFGILTPLGLYFRLIGRDPLNRRFDPQAASYWSPRVPVSDPRRYFRQF